MRRLSPYFLILQCALALTAVAQTNAGPASNTPDCNGLTTADQCDEQWLTHYGVALTKEALMSALHSENPEIQGFAADLLAFRGIKDAIPEIAALLESKSNPSERLHLAQELAELGDERGVQTLRSYCDDSRVSMEYRLDAAQALVRYQPKSCPQTLIVGLQDDTFRVQALGLIPDFKELTPNEAARVRALLLKSLSDLDSSTRLQAARTIIGLGDVSDIPVLQAAIAREPDPFVREAMENSLKSLQDKH